jgi:hypothetical protein
MESARQQALAVFLPAFIKCIPQREIFLINGEMTSHPRSSTQYQGHCHHHQYLSQ